MNKWVNEGSSIWSSLTTSVIMKPWFKQSFLIILYTVSHHENLLRNIMNSSQVPDAGLRENVGILLTKFLQVTTIPYYEMDKALHVVLLVFPAILHLALQALAANYSVLSRYSLPLGITWSAPTTGDTPATFPHLTSFRSFIHTSRNTDPHLLIKEITLPL